MNLNALGMPSQFQTALAPYYLNYPTEVSYAPLRSLPIAEQLVSKENVLQAALEKIKASLAEVHEAQNYAEQHPNVVKMLDLLGKVGIR